MPTFEQTVAVPSTRDYAPPTPDIFSQIAGLPNAYYQGVFNKQQEKRNDQGQQLNEQAIRQGQIRQDIAQTFRGGLPLNKDGTVDYSRAVSMLAQKGDTSALWNGADAMYAQAASKLSPLLAGGGQGGPAPGGGGAGAPPQAAPRTPVQAGNQGDSGSGTIASLVTDRFPNQDTTTGQTIAKIASVMGIDPNVPMTQGQVRRAQGLLQKYAGAASPPPPAANEGGGAAPLSRPSLASAGQDGATPAQRVAGAFGALPPSANAGTPGAPAAPPQRPQPQAAPNGAGSPAPVAQAAPQQQPAPVPQAPPQQQAVPPQQQPASPQQQPMPQQQPGGQPIVPQVPLPKGFTDPQAAILALRGEAARLAANPRAQGQVAELNNWASRIEESIKPVQANPNTTMLDPATGKVLYEGPAAASLRSMETAGGSPTLDADAERYRQSGKLPPNMGRGMQGAAEARVIRQRATEIEVASGGDPSKWTDRWQQTAASGVGKSTAERVRANREENLDIILRATEAAIPAALEASKALPRGDFVPLNKIIQNGQVNTSNPKLVEFGMANLQLAEHWARAMNPTGVMRESDREKALHFLSTAYGNNTYEAAVRQLEKQIKREKAAVREGKGTAAGADPVPGASDAGTVSKDGWTVVTAPNGKKARIQEITE